MKAIGKLITTISGIFASLFVVACDHPTPHKYGPIPPDRFDQNPNAKPSNRDLPQSGDDVGDIYGPPSMLTGDPEPEEEPDALNNNPQDDVLPQDRLQPAPIYGMPMPEIPEPVKE